MKLILVIIGLILSCTFGDRLSIDEKVCCSLTDRSVICSDKQDAGMWDYDSNSFGILPSCTTGFSGGSNNITSSVRSTNSGHRVQPSGKVPFLVIKDGKVIGRHSFHTFLTGLKQFPSGEYSTERYIHSLCKLLI